MKKSCTVLVIDDDDDVRRTICDTLLEQGFTVAEAENGEKGLAMISADRNKTPEVVITDILMPEKDGLGTIREIRKQNPHIKVIAISGSRSRYACDLDFLTMASKLGADAVLPKPLNCDELGSLVISVCNHPTPAVSYVAG
jgi:DNA-binding NtrC family response regulator